jgi:ElaB/YqjD/DUF883 family membrane-anchored ribosome-binding protein
METSKTESRETKKTTPNRHGGHNTHDLSDVAQEAVNVAKDGAKVIREMAQDEVKMLKESSEKYVDEVTTYVKDHPGKSVLFAALGGLILGLLLKK